MTKTNDVRYESLIELWETGLPPFWMKNELPRAPKCFAKSKSETTSKKAPIRLNDLIGPFFILGIGLGLATFAFLLEVIFFKYRQLIMGIGRNRGLHPHRANSHQPINRATVG